MLAEYFEARRLAFPPEMGDYVPTWPDAKDFEAPRGVFLHVVDQTGTAIGCGGVKLIAHMPGVTRLEIKHLWLEPHARGIGLGRALLEELESRALAFGASEVVLDTNASQVAASALYRSSGYVQIDRYNDNPNATHWFAKNLTTELE